MSDAACRRLGAAVGMRDSEEAAAAVASAAVCMGCSSDAPSSDSCLSDDMASSAAAGELRSDGCADESSVAASAPSLVPLLLLCVGLSEAALRRVPARLIGSEGELKLSGRATTKHRQGVSIHVSVKPTINNATKEDERVTIRGGRTDC